MASEGLPDKNTLQQMSVQSYKLEPETDIEGFQLIYKTPTLKFYRKGTTIVIAIRGTQDNSDINADALIAVGKLNTSERYKKDIETIKYIQAKYPKGMYHYYGVGHSLGGAILDLLLDDGYISEGLSYNPAVQPQHLSRHMKNHRIYVEGDPLYHIYINLLSQKPEVRPGRPKEFWEHITGMAGHLYDLYMSHQLKNFEGGGMPDWNVEKQYPDNYSKSVTRVLNAFFLQDGNIKILGSAAIRSIQYAGDYDAIELHKLSPQQLASALKLVVQKLNHLSNTYIADIKCGEINEFKVIRNPYNVNQSRNTLMKIVDMGHKDALEYGHLLKSDISPIELITAKEQFKYHIIRWKPKDILNGYVLYMGKKISLEKAIETGGKIKIDAVSLLNDGRYVEFSCVYVTQKEFKKIDYIKELKESVLDYSLKGNYFKTAKRIFSIARYKNMYPDIAEKLVPIFNGDLGRLYSVISDIEMLLYMIKNKIGNQEAMSKEIQDFKSRLSNIWQVPAFISKEYKFDKALNNASLHPRGAMNELMNLQYTFQSILDKESLEKLKELKLFPILSKFLP